MKGARCPFNAAGRHKWDRVDGKPEEVCERCGLARRRAYGSRRTRGTPRSGTVSVKKITQRSLRETELHAKPAPDVPRPIKRGECQGGERPCPWVSCKHHLYLDVNPYTGSIKFNYPTLEPHELAESCSLDVADRGGHTLEEVGLLTNLTRERVRQIETRGLYTMRFQRSLGKDAA
mgnify:FL=1